MPEIHHLDAKQMRCNSFFMVVAGVDVLWVLKEGKGRGPRGPLPKGDGTENGVAAGPHLPEDAGGDTQCLNSIDLLRSHVSLLLLPVSRNSATLPGIAEITHRQLPQGSPSSHRKQQF